MDFLATFTRLPAELTKAPLDLLEAELDLNDEVRRLVHEEMRRKLDALLSLVKGREFPDLPTKKSFVDRLAAQVKWADFYFDCSVCHKPATLTVGTPGTSKVGSYLFHHRNKGKQETHTAGGLLFPDTHVVDSLIKPQQ